MSNEAPTDALRLEPEQRPFWVNGDYTPSEDMVEAGRDFMPRNVSEENVVSAFIEMMKQAEIDGLITYADKTNATGLDEAQRKAVERAAMDAGADVWRHCRLAMVADSEIVGYPCFSRADMAELARLYGAAPASPLPEGGGTSYAAGGLDVLSRIRSRLNEQIERAEADLNSTVTIRLNDAKAIRHLLVPAAPTGDA